MVTDNKETPLVSIVVITYNSAKYVLETLESCKAQTYDNIELIISDDASTDDTVKICEEWLAENKDRFVRTEIITVEKNSGIPANCNRGVKVSEGEWVKLIAGDDLLIDSCIELNASYALKNKVNFVASNVIEFTEGICSPDHKWYWEVPKKFTHLKAARDQFKYFLSGNTYLSGSAYFIHKEDLLKIGGYLEKYTLVEDRPLLLNWTFNGNFIGVLDEVSVCHRRHNEGVTAKDLFPYYIIDVYRAVIDFSLKSRMVLHLANGIWNLMLLLLEKRFYKSGPSHLVYQLRINFQPIRLLWFKRKFTGKSV